MTDVAAAIAALMAREGPYSDDPADTGGKTAHGVTEAVARAYGYQGAMADLPLSVAADILTKRYWSEPQFDALDRIDPAVAAKLLDTGVNMGPATAARFLQRALNALNDQASDYPDLVPDGVAGAMTRRCLQAFLFKRGVEGRTVLLAMIRAQQAMRYLEIAEAKPSQERFEYGWQAGRMLI